jgi:hypothetical protein
VVTLLGDGGNPVTFTIALVGDDDVVGGTEILINTEGADRLGLSRLSRVLIWDFPSRQAIDAALATEGLISTKVRIRRSWDQFDPDLTLGMAETKAALGEFAYRVGATGSVSIDVGWTGTNLPPGRNLLSAAIPIRARCHLVVEPAITAALAEVAAAGLGGTLNVGDANTAGGCYNPRFNRLTTNSSIGFLSRHTWAMAIDTNTRGSCQGCAPPDMDCRTVQIFRKHGFAWGGNFLTPDGMHFEWVGQPRDQYPYPSRFCPNAVTATNALGAGTEPASTVRARMFADDGLIAD